MKSRRLAMLFVCIALLSSGCMSASKANAKRKKAPVTPEQKLALKEYHLGIDAYTNSRYAEAINHWQVTMEKDPENERAPEYIVRAQTMLKAMGKKQVVTPATAKAADEVKANQAETTAEAQKIVEKANAAKKPKAAKK